MPPIARVRLARSIGRLLRPTLVLLVAAGAAVAAAVAGPIRFGDPAWIALVAAGGLLAVIALRLAVRMLTVGVDVEEAAVRLHWLGGERRYPLMPGPVTRVRLTGEHASSLRARSRWLGWSLGRARLRGEEEIHVVRLAPTPTVILMPTELGRLAIAPASEDSLLEALSRAARARQRLEELVRDAPPVEVVVSPSGSLAPAMDAHHTIGTDFDPTTTHPSPRVLTGIERATLEAQHARELADAEMAPPSTDADAAAMPAPPKSADLSVEHGPRAVDRSGRRRGMPWRRGSTVHESEDQAEASADVASASAVEPESDSPAVVSEPTPAPESGTRPSGRPTGVGRIGAPRPSAAFALLPIIGAGVVWGAATMSSRLPDASTDLAKLAALALAFSGPATSLGALIARTWWPRLVGVVVAGGLVASAFIGRALLGPLN